MVMIMSKKDKRFFYIFITISIILFTIACIRSYISSITMDEALTYNEFVIKNSLFNFNSRYAANNHLLNTFFISIFDKFTHSSYNEFIIRLPNLIFYIFYFIFTYKISKLYKNRYLISSLLILNYSINEFFSIGRGYGIASALVLGGIYFYKLWLTNKNDKDLFKCCSLFILGCLANTIVLIIYFLFIVDCIIRIKKDNNLFQFIKNNKFRLLLILIITSFIYVFHIYVSFRDPNLWFCKSNSLYSCLFLVPISYYGLSIFSSYIMNIFLILLFIIFIVVFVRNFKKIKYTNIFYIIFICLILLIILSIIFPFNIPTGRTLIPFWSLAIISFMEMFDLENNKHLNYFITIPFILLTSICFIMNISFNYVREWENNKNVKNNSYTSLSNKSSVNKYINDYNCFSYYFYNNKIKKQNNYEIIKNQ